MGWKLTYEPWGDVIYLTKENNRPARAVEMPGGIVYRFAEDDGELVGITLIEPPVGVDTAIKLDGKGTEARVTEPREAKTAPPS